MEYQRVTIIKSKTTIRPAAAVHFEYKVISMFVFVFGSMHQHDCLSAGIIESMHIFHIISALKTSQSWNIEPKTNAQTFAECTDMSVDPSSLRTF